MTEAEAARLTAQTWGVRGRQARQGLMDMAMSYPLRKERKSI